MSFFSGIWKDFTRTVLPVGLDIAGETFGIPPEVTNAAYGGLKGGINHGFSGVGQGALSGLKEGAFADAGTAGLNAGASALDLGDTGLTSPLSSLASSVGLADPSTGGGASSFLSNLSGGDPSTGGGFNSGGVVGSTGSNFLTGDVGTDTILGGAGGGGDIPIPSNLDPNNSSSLFSNIGTGSSGGTGGDGTGFGAGAFGNNSAATSLPSSVGGAGNSISNLLSNPSLSTAAKAFGNNAGILTSGAGLVGNALMGGRNLKGYNELKSDAGLLGSQGQQLQQYLQNGTLPPGAQAGLNQASAAAAASIKSQYASRGMSGSSAEAQDLANLGEQVQSQGFNIAMNLMQTGLKETQLSSAIYSQIMEQSFRNDQALGSSITNFATALAGGTGKPNQVVLNLPGQGG